MTGEKIGKIIGDSIGVFLIVAVVAAVLFGAGVAALAAWLL